MVSLIQIEMMKKSEVKGPGHITLPKIKITCRELSIWGVFVYINQSQCRVFEKKKTTIFAITATFAPKLDLDYSQLNLITLLNIAQVVLSNFFPCRSSTNL
jgi:hypothetical protein